ncbi:MAG: hypothetical protein QOK49_2664 [Baekduia sp.]|jgi:hypothetical protein|nr:hypothetical protein [Baekduia sp.]
MLCTPELMYAPSGPPPGSDPRHGARIDGPSNAPQRLP